jgi:hypothetical protein
MTWHCANAAKHSAETARIEPSAVDCQWLASDGLLPTLLTCLLQLKFIVMVSTSEHARLDDSLNTHGFRYVRTCTGASRRAQFTLNGVSGPTESREPHRVKPA